MNASVVVLNWHHWHDLTRPFLTSLVEWTDPALLGNVVIVDQESRDEDVAAILGFSWRGVTPFVVRMPTNVGFPAGCNAGARDAVGDVIVQMNNDVLVRGPWIESVLQELERRPAAVIGASLVTNGGWNEINVKGKRVVIPYLEGWCIAARRETWDEVGPFNEEYSEGGFEDVEWCWRATRLGHPLVPLDALRRNLVHLRGRTVDDGRLNQPSITARNRERFRRRLEEGA